MTSLKQAIKLIYLKSDLDSAIFYAKTLYSLAATSNDSTMMSEAKCSEGIAFARKGDYSRSKESFEIYLNINQLLNHKKATASAMNNLGTVCMRLGEYSRALDLLKESLKISRELNDKDVEASSLNNLGDLHKLTGNLKEAEQYFNKSLKIKDALGDELALASALTNLAELYHKSNNYKKGVSLIQRALIIYRKAGDSIRVSTTLSNLGSVYADSGNYQTAIRYFSQSLISGSPETPKFYSTYSNLGLVYCELDSLSKGLDYCKKGMQLARKSKSVTALMDASINLATAYDKLNHADSALKYYQIHVTMKDSMQSSRRQRTLLLDEINSQYFNTLANNSLKQSLNQNLTHDKGFNQLNIIWVVLTILIIALLFGFYYFQKLKQKATNTIEFEPIVSSIDALKPETVRLNRNRIEESLHAKLNETDWNLLNALMQNPAISNKDLANKVALSIGGTRSSLSKLYRLFELKTARNQRLALVMKAIDISQNVKL